jgi:hypothetical protein
MSTCAKFVIPMALIGLLPAVPAAADTTFFNTGNPDGRMATATRPDSAGGKFEIESADDFILGTKTSITGATFTGLLTDRAPLSSVGEVRVEIYRVFPNDSNVGRTKRHRYVATVPDAERADPAKFAVRCRIHGS